MRKNRNLLKTVCEVCGRHFWSNETRVKEGTKWFHLACYYQQDYKDDKNEG